VQHRLKGLVGEAHLVNLLCCSVSRVRVGTGWSSIWHGSDLVLDA